MILRIGYFSPPMWLGHHEPALPNCCPLPLPHPASRGNILAGSQFKVGSGQKKYTCGRCGRSYSHQPSLCRHRNHECGKEPSFACTLCPHRTKRKANLQLHLQTVHSVDPTLVRLILR